MLSSAGIGCCRGRCGKECTSWRRVDATRSRTGEQLWDGMTVTRTRKGKEGRRVGRLPISRHSGTLLKAYVSCVRQRRCQTTEREKLRLEPRLPDATKRQGSAASSDKCRARRGTILVGRELALSSNTDTVQQYNMSSRTIAQRLTRAQPRALRLSGPARSFASTSQHRAGSGSLLSDDKAAEHDNRWKGTATNGGPTKLLIDGEWVNSTTNDWIDLHDPVRLSLARSLAHARCPALGPPYPAGSHKSRERSSSSTKPPRELTFSHCSNLIHNCSPPNASSPKCPSPPRPS